MFTEAREKYMPRERSQHSTSQPSSIALPRVNHMRAEWAGWIPLLLFIGLLLGTGLTAG
jgi:hypothetical protein